jgi:hypothetical protein
MRSRHGLGGLTIHEGAWAYCDGLGSGDDGHQWRATGGVPLESLVRWATGAVRAPQNGTGHAPENGTPSERESVHSGESTPGRRRG